MPLVSFVVPAFNAEKFLEATVASAQAQTFADWEMIICDDASADGTLALARRLAAAEPRLRVIARTENSGGALLPRLEAVRHARGQWIAPFDADDELEPEYLEKLITAARREDAQVVYPALWRDHSSRIAPADGFDYATRSGAEAVALTLNGWQINTGGGLIKKELYGRMDARSYPHADLGFVDEVFDAELIFPARRVAFSEARYFYRTNPESVSRAVNARGVSFLITDRMMADFVMRNYPEGSPVRLSVQAHRFNRVVEAVRIYATKPIEPSHRSEIWHMIQQAARDIPYAEIRTAVGRLRWPLMRFFGPRGMYWAFRLLGG